MKTRLFTMLAVLALTLVAAATTAQARAPEPGTCPSPWMQDADGDGIPNGQDPDYVRPLDGTGNQYKRGAQPTAGENEWRWQWQWRNLFNGTFGFGPGTGTGECDGTGPHGFGGFGRR
jgi:hypothetical protein